MSPADDTTEVDLEDSKTSKLEVGLELATRLTTIIAIVWGVSGGLSMLNLPIINQEAVKTVFTTLTPIVTATGFGTLIAYIVGKSKE